MTELFCTKCGMVFRSKTGICCGEEASLFSPEKHFMGLIGRSNSWISVYEMWKDHPLFQDAASDMVQEGQYGAATVFNHFVKKMTEENDI